MESHPIFHLLKRGKVYYMGAKPSVTIRLTAKQFIYLNPACATLSVPDVHQVRRGKKLCP